jgi:hypothetical protein
MTTLTVQEMYEGNDDRIHLVHSEIQAKSGGRSRQPDPDARPSRKHYYVWAAYQEKGPYTIKELRAALKDQKLSASTPVRADDEIESRSLEALLRQHPSKKAQG